MTDYLEEHLGGAETLLERIRRLEQSASTLHRKTDLEENVDYVGDFAENTQETDVKGGIVSKKEIIVYDTKKEVDQIKNTVDKMDAGLEIREKEQDIAVNYYIKPDNNSRNLRQTGTVSGGEETQTSGERMKARSPLSIQLEDLDRAVSVLTAPVPGGRERARGSYPISLPQGPSAGQNITDVPDEAWSGHGTADSAGFAYGGKRSWVEQADRMFRRDSRRYDGGFTLY